MFERNKIDTVDQTGVPVELTTQDGETHKGRLLVATGRPVFDVLNGASAFVEFEAYGGERTYIAKSALRSVKAVNVPRSVNLNSRLRDQDGFDPHMVLGVKAAASFEEIKQAWHRLSKLYHPDRYHGMELPEEVKDYLAAMARRVNLAFAALEAPHQAQRRAHNARATPVYTSRQAG